MKLKEIKKIFHRELDGLFPQEEVNSFYYLLIEEYYGLNRFILVLDPERAITKKQEQPLFEALAQLRKEYTIQYILNKTRFMDLDFKVDEQVLIPRPETEELVRWILEERADRGVAVNILDLGSGSGCISIALAKYWPEARITALDISSGALEIARKNAKIHAVSIDFLQEDILTLDRLDQSWDIMVSNPPYIRNSEKDSLPNNVRLYEPASALFVPDELPLVFYEHIIRLAASHLKSGGSLYLEINEQMGTETQELLKTADFSQIVLRKDLFGKERMLRARKSKFREEGSQHHAK